MKRIRIYLTNLLGFSRKKANGVLVMIALIFVSAIIFPLISTIGNYKKSIPTIDLES
ncbi:MAG: hypothetical protein HQ474_12540 [Flammeovirgaceae bacterium]|nr:hypothetical protein [Flammeovirgaceae bacterium]|tara:strand:+ start:139010 stop:139180 length:171 start_codon:yes stop_codon:yes gene_type:complete